MAASQSSPVLFRAKWKYKNKSKNNKRESRIPFIFLVRTKLLYSYSTLYMRIGVQLGRVEAQPVPNVNEDAMPESEPDRSDSGSGQAESEREGEEKAVQEFEVTEAA